MAKVEAFPLCVILPEPDSAGPHGLGLSVHAAVTEPDLIRGSDRSDDWAGLRQNRGISLGKLREANLLHEPEAPAIVIGVPETGGLGSLAIWCRYPIKWLREVADQGPELPSFPPEAEEAYLELIRRSNALLDPITVALPDLKPDHLPPLRELGKPVCRYLIPGRGAITLRAVTTEHEIRAVSRALDPGFFGPRPNGMILDGPWTMARAAHNAGESHVFACIVPVGNGAASLVQQELLIEVVNQLPAPPVAWKSEESPNLPATDSEPEKRLVKLEHPDVVQVIRHWYSSDASRDHSRAAWEEDQAIESVVADTCAMMVRGADLFLLAVGRRTRDTLAIPSLYQSDAIATGTFRRSLAPFGSAISAYSRGLGHAACWPQMLDPAESTQRILRRRPPLATRRALIATGFPLPSLAVVHRGLR